MSRAEAGGGGVFVFTSVPGRKGPIKIQEDLLMRRLVLDNQLVFGTVNAGPETFKAAIVDLTQFHDRWPGALDALITGRHRPEDFAELLTGPRSGIKPVIRFRDAV